MLRKFVCAVFALVVCGSLALADEVKGKLKKADAAGGTITVTVDGQDKDFKVDKDTKITDNDGKALEGGLKASAFKNAGADVTITTDKDTVKSVKIGKK